MFIGNIIKYSQLIIFSGLCPDGRTFDEHYTIWEIVSKNHLYEGFDVFFFLKKNCISDIYFFRSFVNIVDLQDFMSNVATFP